MKTTTAQEQKDSLLKCLNQIHQQSKDPEGFSYPITKGMSQLRSFLKENEVPFYQKIERVLRETFVHIKVTGYGKFKKTGIFWVNPVHPNSKMVDEIFKRRNSTKPKKRQVVDTTHDNPLSFCLSCVYLANENGRYFQYSKGSLQSFLKNNDVKDYIEVDRYLRHNKIIVNMSAGRQRAEYQWTFDGPPTQRLIDKIEKATCKGPAMINSKSSNSSFPPKDEVEFNLLEERYLAMLRWKFTMDFAYNLGKSYKYERSTVEKLIKKLIESGDVIKSGDVYTKIDRNPIEKLPVPKTMDHTFDTIAQRGRRSADITIVLKDKSPTEQSIDIFLKRIKTNEVEMKALELQIAKDKVAVEQLKTLI